MSLAVDLVKNSWTYLNDLTEPWVADRDMTDQFGKVAIVTGGNSGLGLEIVRQLVKNQAYVIMASRDEAKADRAIADIKKDIPWAKVEYLHIDLASFGSVKEFVHNFKAKGLPLHMLFNNGGEFFPPPAITENDYDVTLQVNYFSPVLLTQMLMDVLQHSAPARIINMSSQAHMYGWIDWDDLRGRNYSDDSNVGRGLRAYGTSKLMLLMWSMELHKRCRGMGIDVFAVHPGVAKTPLPQKVDLLTFFPVSDFFYVLVQVAGQSPRYGASSALYTATEPRLQGRGGRYVGPDQVFARFFNTSERWVLNPQAWKASNRARLFDETIKLLKETATSKGQHANVPKPVVSGHRRVPVKSSDPSNHTSAATT